MIRLKYLLSALLLSALMFLPNLAVADNSTDYSNSGGTLAGSNAGLTLTGSTLIAVTSVSGGGGSINGNLGTVEFATGALTSGSLQMGGTLAAGGWFTITGNGTNGVGNGTLFTGAFSGPVTWSLTTLANGTHNYTLTGVLVGSGSFSGINGVTVQLTINTGKGLFSGSTLISGGDTTITSSVPEPSTLALLGTGVLALAGGLRRKVLAR
ncbi:MAG TPA: PEP-CTERM sorting domain-containing protein [Candidatus Sulfotelmatobacter sp.]|nr:PEP-CTERM sorting domain-containing protein [Candidatus Sulfotelmatobacter sp.]